MANRISYYSLYALAYATRAAHNYNDFSNTLASSLGCIDGLKGAEMLTPSQLAAKMREMGADLTDGEARSRELEQAKEALELACARVLDLEERDRKTRDELEADRNETTPEAARRVASTVPDCGPTGRDRREAQAARERLQRLILADGKTDTGGRSLYDSAADEIVRLRIALSSAEHAAKFPAPDVTRAALNLARERGAAEMRERAAALVDDEVDDVLGAGSVCIDRASVAQRIRALPPSPAPAHVDIDAGERRKSETFRTLEAMGVEFSRAMQAARIAEEEGGAAPETAHSACLRIAKMDGPVGFFNEGEHAADMLRRRIRAMIGQSAAGERAAAKLSPEDSLTPGDHTSAAWRTANPSGGLSAEDAQTLHGAGFVEKSRGAWEVPATVGGLIVLRWIAAGIRAEKGPAAAHGAPGRVSGGEVAAAGENSVAPSQGAMQGLPKPARVEAGQRWRHSHDPGLWAVGEVDRHNDDMLVTLHTEDGRQVRVCESWLTKGPYWTFLGPAPAPQDPKRDGEAKPDDTIRDPREDAPAMRIEKRADGHEYIIGTGYELNDCMAVQGDRVCHYHLDGDHIATRTTIEPDGAERIVARWPIAPSQDEPSDADKIASLQADVGADVRDGIRRMLADGEVMTSADEHVTVIVRNGVESRAVLATVAELLGLPDQQDQQDEARSLSDLRRAHHADQSDEPADIDDRWQRRREQLSRAAHGSASAFERAYVNGMRDAYTVAAVEMRRTRGQVEPAPVAPDREQLGREVRAVWVAWAHEQPYPKSSWLVPWEQLSAPDQEVYRRIGERLFAMGVEEGERRAAVQIPDLMTRTHHDGVVEGERRAKAKAEELVDRWEGIRSRALAAKDVAKANTIVLCMTNLRYAFGVHGAPDPVKPPTGGEPGPEGDGFPADVPPEVDEHAAEVAALVDERVTKVLEQRGGAPPTDADERWQPGAVWEHRAGSLPDVATFTLQRVDANGDVWFLDAYGRTCWSTREDMTGGTGCGWRYVGRSASEAGPDEEHGCGGPREACAQPGCEECGAPKDVPSAADIAQAMVSDSGWIEGERGGVALRSDMSVEGARGIIERLVVRIRSERSGAIERAHADGVVEGLCRADGIIRSFGRRGEMSPELIAALDVCIGTAIAEAGRAVPADRQNPVDRAALLKLAEGWETEARQYRKGVRPPQDGRLDTMSASSVTGAMCLESSAHDLRRLLDAPRGPGGGEREPVAPSSPTSDVGAAAARREMAGGKARCGWWAMAPRRRALLVDWLAARMPVVRGEALSGPLLEAACDVLRGRTPGGDVPPGPDGERADGTSTDAAQDGSSAPQDVERAEVAAAVEEHRRSVREAMRRLVDDWDTKRRYLIKRAARQRDNMAEHFQMGAANRLSLCIADLCSLAGIEPSRTSTPGPDAQDGSRVDQPAPPTFHVDGATAPNMERDVTAWLAEQTERIFMGDPAKAETRSVDVYAEVRAERRAQDAKWGGPAHDDEHREHEWLHFIADKTRKAQAHPGERRRRLVQIAALAVAAIESMDRAVGPAEAETIPPSTPSSGIASDLERVMAARPGRERVAAAIALAQSAPTPHEVGADTAQLARAVEALKLAGWPALAHDVGAAIMTPERAIEALRTWLRFRELEPAETAAIAALEVLCAAPAEEQPRKDWNRCPRCKNLVDADDVHDGSEVRCHGCKLTLVCTSMTDGTWTLVEADEEPPSDPLDPTPPKPERVEPGQVWRCVGVDGELVVSEVRLALAPFSGDIGLRPVGATGPATVRARDRDMLGLPQWTFIRGPAPREHEAEQDAIVDRMARARVAKWEADGKAWAETRKEGDH